jgi:RnfABCDGE-type electron transport complex B subunit
MLIEILRSTAIVAGVGLVFGILITIAHMKLKVWEDPRIDTIADMLPGSNCGACGQAGCRAFAEALIAGKVAPATCSVMGPEDVEDVAALLGVDAGEAQKRVARLLCAGGTDVAIQQAQYRGMETCKAAVAVAGGGKGCPWGCLGLNDCGEACDFDAIVLNEHRIPVVLLEKCTACGDCVDACPLDLFTIMPVEQQLIVQCKNLLAGDDAENACKVACNACARCVADAAPGLIQMVNNLPVIDYEKNELASPEAVGRCPTGAIVWLNGQQFADTLELVRSAKE